MRPTITKKGTSPVYGFLREANLLRVPPITVTRLLTQILIPVVGLEMLITLLFPLEAMCASPDQPSRTSREIESAYKICKGESADMAKKAHELNDKIPLLGTKDREIVAQSREQINETQKNRDDACLKGRSEALKYEHRASSDSEKGRGRFSASLEGSLKVGRDAVLQVSAKVEKEPATWSPHHVDGSGDMMYRDYFGGSGSEGSKGGGAKTSAFVAPLLEGNEALSKFPSPATGDLSQIHGSGNAAFEALYALKDKIDLFFDNYIEFVEGSIKKWASFFKK